MACKNQPLHGEPGGTGLPALNSDGAAQPHFSAGARAAIVNRTHRVVRERAQQLKARRSSVRSLVVPLLICSVLLLMMSYALWTVLSSGGASIGELQVEAGRLLDVHAMDTDGPLSVLFFWFLPVSAVTMGTVLFRRSRGRGDGEVTR